MSTTTLCSGLRLLGAVPVRRVRYLATQQYYVQMPSAVAIYLWDGAFRNYGPNLGYDYGGRLQAAWLER